jgi:hypothetical protein
MANNENLKKGKATQFSSNNQPPNRGRKASVLNFIKESGLSTTDVKRLLGSLIWEYDAKELAGLLKDKENAVPMGMALILGALTEDLKNKNLANFEKLMDRTYGRPTQKEIVEFSDVPDSAKDRLNRIFGDAQKSSEKIKPKIVSKKTGRKKEE